MTPTRLSGRSDPGRTAGRELEVAPPGTVGVVYGRVRRLLVVAGCAVAVGLPAACGAAPRPELKSAPAVTAAVSVPADGLAISRFGVRNGPATAFSVPRDVVVTTTVDQPSGVTLVFSNPTPATFAGYLRRALPQTGFVVTHDQPPATLTFSGYGWQGSFTGTGRSSAVTLRP